MKAVSILFFLTLMSLTSTGQLRRDSLLAEVEQNKKEVFNSLTFSLTKNKKEITSPTSRTYESQGLYHSTYLILNADTSFIYYSIYEVGFDLTVGRWAQVNMDTFALNWDKKQTLYFVKDEKKYRKYYKYGSPLFVPMTNWLIKISNEKLVPILNTIDR